MIDKIYVIQDGSHFYVYEDEGCYKLIRVEICPFKVLDFDMAAAIKAREWFEESGYFRGSKSVVWC